MDVEKCNCGAIEMEVAENQYFDEAIHHRGTARCIPLTDVADYAQLATLRDERDRAVRILRMVTYQFDRALGKDFVEFHSGEFEESMFVPGDFDYLRQLIEGEEGQ